MRVKPAPSPVKRHYIVIPIDLALWVPPLSFAQFYSDKVGIKLTGLAPRVAGRQPHEGTCRDVEKAVIISRSQLRSK